MLMAKTNQSKTIEKVEAQNGPENEIGIDDNYAGIIESDTAESLKIKFPSATPYEMEFLLFLKSRKNN